MLFYRTFSGFFSAFRHFTLIHITEAVYTTVATVHSVKGRNNTVSASYAIAFGFHTPSTTQNHRYTPF